MSKSVDRYQSFDDRLWPSRSQQHLPYKQTKRYLMRLVNRVFARDMSYNTALQSIVPAIGNDVMISGHLNGICRECKVTIMTPFRDLHSGVRFLFCFQCECITS